MKFGARVLSKLLLGNNDRKRCAQKVSTGAAAAENALLSPAYSNTSLMQWASSTTNRATLMPFRVFTNRSLLNRSGET